jgi:hypothetical protein
VGVQVGNVRHCCGCPFSPAKQLVENVSIFYGTHSSLPCSHQLDTIHDLQPEDHERALSAYFFEITFNIILDDFGGLVVSMLASGTRVRGFKPGRTRWIFRTSEKSSTCLLSEGKWKNLSHVQALRHVKEPSTSVNYDVLAKYLL